MFFVLTRPSRFFIGVLEAFNPWILTEFSNPFKEVICVDDKSINFMFFNLLKELILVNFFALFKSMNSKSLDEVRPEISLKSLSYNLT